MAACISLPFRHIEVYIQFSVCNTETINQLSAFRQANERRSSECMYQKEKANDCWKNKYEMSGKWWRWQTTTESAAAATNMRCLVFRAYLCISIAYLFQLTSESVWKTECKHCYNSSCKNDYSLLKKCRTKKCAARTAYESNKSHRTLEYVFVYAYFAFYFTAIALFIWPF